VLCRTANRWPQLLKGFLGDSDEAKACQPEAAEMHRRVIGNTVVGRDYRGSPHTLDRLHDDFLTWAATGDRALKHLSLIVLLAGPHGHQPYMHLPTNPGMYPTLKLAADLKLVSWFDINGEVPPDFPGTTKMVTRTVDMPLTNAVLRKMAVEAGVPRSAMDDVVPVTLVTVSLPMPSALRCSR